MRAFPIAMTVAACAACTSPPPPPFHPAGSDPVTGVTDRFRVDDILLPSTMALATSFGSAVLGEDDVNNALGFLIAGLAGDNDVDTDAQVRALIGSGAVASEVDLTYSDEGDSAVGMQYIGEPGDDPTMILGAQQADGSVAASGLQAGATDVVLPVFVGAAPSTVYFDFAQFELTPDGSGSGYVARIQGLVDPGAAVVATCTGVEQMIASDPASHEPLEQLVGSAYDTCVASNAVRSLLAPDVQAADGAMYLSFGFGVHLAPIAE